MRRRATYKRPSPTPGEVITALLAAGIAVAALAWVFAYGVFRVIP